MKVEFVTRPQMNQALHIRDILPSDLDCMFKGNGTFPENLIEYAGRLCYHSTRRMGTAPNFISNRVKEGHEDIIEHVAATFRIFNSESEPLWWRVANRHCEVSHEKDGSWLVTGNLRVWLDLFRRGLALDILPYMQKIAPKVYAEFETVPMEDFGLRIMGTCWLAPYFPRSDDSGMAVTLLAHTGTGLDHNNIEAMSKHGTATFLFEGISRACTHQLVRHRLGSYSQCSQRYISLDKGAWDIVIPPAIASNERATNVLNSAWLNLRSAYADLRAAKILKEDARCILPNATETRIIVTMNYEAWSHFFWLRACDKAAQYEIRKMGQWALEMLYHAAWPLFSEHFAECRRKFSDDFIRDNQFSPVKERGS